MYPGDARHRWHADLLQDPRLVHRWDEQKTVGRFFMTHRDWLRPAFESQAGPTQGDALWDAWVLFDRTGTWTGTTPGGLVGWGATVLKTRERLTATLRTLSAGKVRPGPGTPRK